jgi:catechol 2,3-dioxygenase-like lactoylglutathione lyase family enzyme
MNDQSIGRHYLDDALKTFRNYKKLAERAFAQISDEDFFRTLDEESNSIAVNMKHMAGNMISRWTDFLNTDGEKPDRDRDVEFVMLPGTTKEEMLAYWEKGWKCTFDAIAALQPVDLMRNVHIRGREHTVIQAVNRQLTHYAYHVGQIVYLAKHFTSRDWQSLSVPKNRSTEFNVQFQNRAVATGSGGEQDAREPPTRMSALPQPKKMVIALHHVNVTVPSNLEAATKEFYGSVLGLSQVPKPAAARQSGAWYQIGDNQLHLSIEDDLGGGPSTRHVCFTVSDLVDTEKRFRAAGVEVIPDPRPVPGSIRFYVRDPGGNQLEIVQTSG